MRFIGNIEAKIDSKGRAFLPAAFRKELQAASEERLVMRRDVFQSCLVLYPGNVWDRQLDELRSRLNRWNAEEQQIFRQFVADVEIVPLDASGRILIPGRLQRAIDIRRSIRFIGMDDTIEIWTAEATEQPFMDARSFSEALQRCMGESGGSCREGGES